MDKTTYIIPMDGRSQAEVRQAVQSISAGSQIYDVDIVFAYSVIESVSEIIAQVSYIRDGIVPRRIPQEFMRIFRLDKLNVQISDVRISEMKRD